MPGRVKIKNISELLKLGLLRGEVKIINGFFETPSRENRSNPVPRFQNSMEYLI